MAPVWSPDDDRQRNPDPGIADEQGKAPAAQQDAQRSSTLNFPSSPSPTTGPQLVSPGSPQPHSSVAIWIDRLGLVIRVVFYIELGMLLAVLPWTRLWTENSLVLGMPRLHEAMQMNFLRGLVTGVGLVDIWIGIWEAVRYRESRKK